MSYDKMKKFYEGKRVLVCGSSGMTGRNLAVYLKEELGADVLGTHHSMKEFHNQFHSFHIDLTDAPSVRYLFDTIQPLDYVFICCAKTYNAQVCLDNPEAMILPNIQMTSNILENCLATRVKKVLFMSSSVVYQPSYKVLSEEDLDLNVDPYPLYMGIGWVKRYLEKLCQFYSRQGLKTVVVRPTNIYGKYDKYDEKVCHVIPALVMRALEKKDPFIVYGNGANIKDFIHVNDLIRDMTTIAALYDTPDPINLCSGEHLSLAEVAWIIKSKVSAHHVGIQFTEDVPAVVPFKGLSHTKFDSLFGKRQYIKFEQGIDEVINWYSSLRQTQS